MIPEPKAYFKGIEKKLIEMINKSKFEDSLTFAPLYRCIKILQKIKLWWKEDEFLGNEHQTSVSNRHEKLSTA